MAHILARRGGSRFSYGTIFASREIFAGPAHLSDNQPMNHRLTLLFILVFAAAALAAGGALRGQMRQGEALTIFFTGDDAGEIAPCG
jgi:hypothetical protein